MRLSARFARQARGYTLIELLVVLAMMAIVGVVIFVNFRTFREEQRLKNATSELQSNIRVAQTNATSNLKCGPSSGASWLVVFTDRTHVNLKCQLSPTDEALQQRSLPLGEHIVIYLINNSESCSRYPVSTIFSPLSGKIEFTETDTVSGNPAVCNSQTLKITLKDTKTNQTKDVTIDKGGTIYVD